MKTKHMGQCGEDRKKHSEKDQHTVILCIFKAVGKNIEQHEPYSSNLKHTVLTSLHHFSLGAPAHRHKHTHARTQGQSGRCRVICIMKQARSPKGRRCALGSNEGCAYGIRTDL